MKEIETERLCLREWKSSDFVPFAMMNRSKRACEFLPKTLSTEESDSLAKRFIDHHAICGFAPYAVEEKQHHRFIGYVGLMIPTFEASFMPAVEIGWRLSPDYWGRGYASEAALSVLGEGFGALGLHEIVSFTVPQNQRSIRVMEKIGMVHDPDGDFMHPALPNGHPLSYHLLYRVIRSQFLAEKTL